MEQMFKVMEQITMVQIEVKAKFIHKIWKNINKKASTLRI